MKEVSPIFLYTFTMLYFQFIF